MEEKITVKGFETLGKLAAIWNSIPDVEKAYLLGRAEAKAEDARKENR